MIIIIKIFYNNNLIRTDEVKVYPNFPSTVERDIDLTDTIDDFLKDLRGQLMPPEGHEEELDGEPHPG